MIRSKALTLLALGMTLALALTGPVSAQSEMTPQTVVDPTRPPGGHYHVGEIGEKLLIVEHSLRCNCSCGLDVHSCQFQMQCGTSPVWSQRILRSLEAGESVEAIQASFVADFGGTVLMSPPAEGFNLIGYLLPSIAIVTAGMLIGLIVRGNAGRRESAPARELGQEEEARLREALRKLDETEGPDW
jgi:cytochrome c-type biogenesis protein CcmH/NrfF